MLHLTRLSASFNKLGLKKSTLTKFHNNARNHYQIQIRISFLVNDSFLQLISVN